MTHYDNLGVEATATHNEIADAFRALAKVLHPDQGGDTVTFSILTEPYNVLCEPEQRNAYDRTLHESPPADDSSPRSGSIRMSAPAPSLFDQVALNSNKKHNGQAPNAGQRLAGGLSVRLALVLIVLVALAALAAVLTVV